MESPELQSPAAPAGLLDHRQHNGIPGRKPALLSPSLHSVSDQGRMEEVRTCRGATPGQPSPVPLSGRSPQVQAQSLGP